MRAVESGGLVARIWNIAKMVFTDNLVCLPVSVNHRNARRSPKGHVVVKRIVDTEPFQRAETLSGSQHVRE
jgi:hypothetical protein